jgi:hypothetical protein
VFPALGFCENKTLRLLGKPTTFFLFRLLGGCLLIPKKDSIDDIYLKHSKVSKVFSMNFGIAKRTSLREAIGPTIRGQLHQLPHCRMVQHPMPQGG